MEKRIILLGDGTSNHIIKWARDISGRGYEIVVVSCGGTAIEGIETHMFGGEPGGAKNFFRFLFAARAFIKKRAPSLVHAFQATGYGLWGATRTAGCSRILTPLGSDITINGRKGWLNRAYLSFVLHRYDHYTTPSNFLKEDMARLFPFTESKTTVIPFGVELPEKGKEAVSQEPVRIVYMKHLLPVYGPQVLIRALALIRKESPAVHLDMYGHEYESGWVREMVREYGISELVSFRGWIDMDRIYECLQEYDFMVMPSLSESFGVAALEAAAVGLPVVATRVGGIPEIVIDGETGLLVPADDPQSLAEAIRSLAGDVDLRKKMGLAARDRAGKYFRRRESVDQMIRLYETLINKKK